MRNYEIDSTAELHFVVNKTCIIDLVIIYIDLTNGLIYDASWLQNRKCHLLALITVASSTWVSWLLNPLHWYGF